MSQMLYPEKITCICCGGELCFETDESLCPKCILPQNSEYCLRCGRHTENMAQYCDTCMNRKWEFDLARSAFNYCDKIIPIIYRFKYSGEGYLAKYLTAYMHRAYLFSDFVADVVVYVPIHKSRKRRRGYNQSELLAKEFCALSNLPLINALEKYVKTKPMSKLKGEKRAAAIKDTMRLICSSDEIKDKKLILIDDVLTTGSTVNESSKVLKKADVAEIMVLTVASVEIKPDLY